MKKRLFENPANKDALSKLYLRYFDDVYTVFQTKNSCSKFLDLLSFQHKDVEFTVEKATDTLNFLMLKLK